MPLLPDVTTGALSGDTPDKKIDSMARQINDWGRLLSNEKIASVQRGEDGNIRIVQGVQTIGTTRVVGTVYYDENDIPRILIGLAPDDGRPGIWISEDGQNVIDLLTS